MFVKSLFNKLTKLESRNSYKKIFINRNLHINVNTNEKITSDNYGSVNN